MEEVNKVQEPAPAVSDLQKAWQEYLQKSCEVGQLDHALEQIDSQKREIEKNLEVTKRARNKAAVSHRDIQQSQRAKDNAAKSETPQEESH